MQKKPRKVFEEKLAWTDKVAQIISDFVGNVWFVWIHAIIFTGWITINLVLRDGWDPYPFIFLVLVVSLEAIFLSTFVLMAQNRESRENEIRDQLDYEVDVRTNEDIQEIKKLLNQLVREKKK